MQDFINWNDHEGVLHDVIGKFKVIDCKNCGFKHVIPIPNVKELEDVYRDSYYSNEKPQMLEEHKKDLNWWNISFRERYDIFESIILENERRILDVGSGPGYFLLHGLERGWQTLGIEPSLQASKYSRDLGLEIIEDYFNDETIAELGNFSVVHLSYVLEHVPNPIKLIRQSHSILNSGGIICIVVPNEYNHLQNALRESKNFTPWWLAPPHHINYFDFNSLTKLLEKEGFEVFEKESTFPMEIFLLMGENYIGNSRLGRDCHNLRKKFELVLEETGLSKLKREFYKSLANLGLGREVIIYAKKI